MTKNTWTRLSSFLLLLAGLFNPTSAQQQAPKRRPNVLLLVADDMNWDSPGCFGGCAPDVTPNIDRLAKQGMRFWQAYVNISICTPSRSVMLTGLYPQRNGAEGFQRIHPGTPTLPALLNEAGYLCGTVGKPLSQQELFRWSVTYRWQGAGDEDQWGRDPTIYRRFAKRFFGMAKASKQPFFLMASSHDPHRPFGKGKTNRKNFECIRSSRTYKPSEVKVPGFLPDLPAIRKDLAGYSTSVRRLDDMVGSVLDELEKSQLAEDTIVIFLSDHGMPFPGAKFNCYVDSVRTPLIVRWPNKVAAGSQDKQHLISTVDLQSTILHAVGLSAPKSDGRSFLPLLRGGKQQGRNEVFVQFNHIHGADALPMRAVIGRDHVYVFNPWSNGKRRFQRLHRATYSAMQKAAAKNARLAGQVRHLRYRTVEEFFDRRKDPHCLTNLAGKSSAEMVELRRRLRRWLIEMKDPAAAALDRRAAPAALERYVKQYRAKAAKIVEELKPYEKKKGYRF